MSHHLIEFVPSGRGKAQCAPNPEYPHGICVDFSKGAETTCVVDIPYPAKECGHFVVKCNLCRFSVALTAAGRLDDPIKITLACHLQDAGKRFQD